MVYADNDIRVEVWEFNLAINCVDAINLAWKIRYTKNGQTGYLQLSGCYWVYL